MTQEQLLMLKLAEDADLALYRIEQAMSGRINPSNDPVVEQITDGIGDVRQLRRQIHRWKVLIEKWKPIE